MKELHNAISSRVMMTICNTQALRLGRTLMKLSGKYDISYGKVEDGSQEMAS